MPQFIAYHQIGVKLFDPPKYICVVSGTPEDGGHGYEYLWGRKDFDTHKFRFGPYSFQRSNRRTIHTLKDVPDEIAAAWMRAYHKGQIK